MEVGGEVDHTKRKNDEGSSKETGLERGRGEIVIDSESKRGTTRGLGIGEERLDVLASHTHIERKMREWY